MLIADHAPMTEDADTPNVILWRSAGLLPADSAARRILDLLGDGLPTCTRSGDTTTSTFETIWCGNVRTYGAERLAVTVHEQLAPGGRLLVRGWAAPQSAYYIPYRLGSPPGLMDRVNAALHRAASHSMDSDATFWEERTILGYLDKDLGLTKCRLITPTMILRHPISAAARRWIQEEWDTVRTNARALAHLWETDREQYQNLTDPAHPDYLLSRPDFLYLRYDTVAVGVKPPV